MVSSRCCAYCFDVRWRRYWHAQGSGIVQSTLFYLIVITLFCLSSVPLHMIPPNVFPVRFFVLPRQGAVFLILFHDLFQQNEHLHILISQIIDLRILISNTRRPGKSFQSNSIFISIHLSFPSMLVMFLILRFCLHEPFLHELCANIHIFFYIFFRAAPTWINRNTVLHIHHFGMQWACVHTWRRDIFVAWIYM